MVRIEVTKDEEAAEKDRKANAAGYKKPDMSGPVCSPVIIIFLGNHGYGIWRNEEILSGGPGPVHGIGGEF